MKRALRAVPSLALLLVTGCSGGMIGDGDQPVTPGSSPDAGVVSTPVGLDSGPAPAPTLDGFFTNDPPPQYCGPDGGWQPPPPPGGTPACPDDKNLQGCPCTKQGQTAACWPGARRNRNHGQCKDGVTTCELNGELQLYWGPCQGAVLPTPGVTKGPGACTCFSQGQWQIDNLSPCLVTYPDSKVYAVSTYVNSAGQPSCPTLTASSQPPPTPQAGQPWSKNRLTVDCAGQFKLCLTLKAGDVNNPAATDCELAQVCVDAWYPQQAVAQELPPLPSWTSADAACAAAFNQKGGYGEMSVTGTSIECEPVDDGGKPRVFHRFVYCPLICAQQPSLPQCQNCTAGGSGSF